RRNPSDDPVRHQQDEQPEREAKGGAEGVGGGHDEAPSSTGSTLRKSTSTSPKLQSSAAISRAISLASASLSASISSSMVPLTTHSRRTLNLRVPPPSGVSRCQCSS